MISCILLLEHFSISSAEHQCGSVLPVRPALTVRQHPGTLLTHLIRLHPPVPEACGKRHGNRRGTRNVVMFKKREGGVVLPGRFRERSGSVATFQKRFRDVRGALCKEEGKC